MRLFISLFFATLLLSSLANARSGSSYTEYVVQLQTESGRTFCSGTVIHGTGHILTAAHCVADSSVWVRWAGKRFQAKVLRKNDTQDLAVLNPVGFRFSRRSGVRLGTYPRYGDTVTSIGHAMGDKFPYTLTRGVVSHPKRDGLLDTPGPIWLQSDTALIGGMSGGPLLNRRGRLVGVNQFVMQQPTRYCGEAVCPMQDAPIYGFGHLSEIENILNGNNLD